jgi:hypothetical protein
MNKKTLNDSKLFEKIEIGWFTPDEMRARRSEFREFYREILDMFLADISKIRAFIQRGPQNKTKKYRKK